MSIRGILNPVGSLAPLCGFSRVELLQFCITICVSGRRTHVALSYERDRGTTTSECNLIWRDSSSIGGVDAISSWGVFDLTRPDV